MNYESLDFIRPEYRDIRVELVDPSKGKTGFGRRRGYLVDGHIDLLPSVTQITGIQDKSGGLVPWARKDSLNRMAERLLAVEAGNLPGEDAYSDYISQLVAECAKQDNSAREQGTTMHQMIDAALKGQQGVEADPEIAKQVAPSVRVAVDLIKQRNYEVVATELPVFHPKLDYGGTIDLLCRDALGNLIVMDWKRTKALYPESAVQVAAYTEALLAISVQSPLRFKAEVVRIPRDDEGEPEIRGVDLGQAWQIFIGMIGHFKANRRHNKNVWL